MSPMIKGLLKLEAIIIFTISILYEQIEAIESITARLFCFNHPIHQYYNQLIILQQIENIAFIR